MAQIELTSTLLAIRDDPSLSDSVGLCGFTAGELIDADVTGDGVVTDDEFLFYRQLVGTDVPDETYFLRQFSLLAASMPIVETEVEFKTRFRGREDDVALALDIWRTLREHSSDNNNVRNEVIIDTFLRCAEIKDSAVLAALFDKVINDRAVFDRINVLFMSELAKERHLGDKYVKAVVQDIVENHERVFNAGEFLRCFESDRELVDTVRYIFGKTDKYYLKSCSKGSMSYDCRHHISVVKQAAARELCRRRSAPEAAALIDELLTAGDKYIKEEIEKQ